MKNLLYLISCFVVLSGVYSCKKPKTGCNVFHGAPTSQLVFRVFDAITKEDLFLTSQLNKLNKDSFSASQPGNPSNPLVWDPHTYTVPSKNGLPTRQGFVFGFFNLSNPGIYDPAENFTITLRWNSHDSDKVTWTTSNQTDGDCPDCQVLSTVFFNGAPTQLVFDTAYEYYLLYK